MVVQITIHTRHTIKSIETGSVTHTVGNFVKYLKAECPELSFEITKRSKNALGEDVTQMTVSRPLGIEEDEFNDGIYDLGEVLNGLEIVSDYWLDEDFITAPQAVGQNQTPASQ